jgi:hypothetical protein
MEPRADAVERQGLLVEEQALQRAEAECLNDAEARARRRKREAERRQELDAVFGARFAARIRQLYPGCPPDLADRIASHACQKYSGRVGRSAAARRQDQEAVRLAVVAHVRHDETRTTSSWRAASSAGTRAIASVRTSTVLARWRQ